MAETIFQYAALIDSEAVMEPREVVPTQNRLRPADILTAAASRLMAADFGITTPARAISAERAKEDMFERKTQERESIEADLEKQGIKYAPMIASHFGSLHPIFNDWVCRLAKACARRRGWATTAVERQLRSRLGACLARRAARMSLATWGKDEGEGEVILPILEPEYEDIDRTAEGQPQGADEAPGTTPGEGVRQHTAFPTPAAREEPQQEDRPWDPGRDKQWGPSHGWKIEGGVLAPMKDDDDELCAAMTGVRLGSTGNAPQTADMNPD